MRTSDVLDLAADKIQQHGWTQINGWNATPEFGARVLGYANEALCLEGAIMAAAGLQLGRNLGAPEDVRLCPAYGAVQEYLEFEHLPLYAWNDKPERTAAEVIEVLRAAAAVERLKESSYDTEDQPLPLEVVA